MRSKISRCHSREAALSNPIVVNLSRRFHMQPLLYLWTFHRSSPLFFFRTIEQVLCLHALHDMPAMAARSQF